MFFQEDFVVESYDHLVDENDNYNCKYSGHLINNVAPSDSDLYDEPLCKIIRIESIPESVFIASDESSRESHREQTMHSVYFSELPSETSTVELKREEPEKMVNVPLLLHQLRSARVVLDRQPHNPVVDDTTTPSLEIDNPIVDHPPPTCKNGVQRYCHKCQILDIDHNRVTSAKLCTKCSTTLLYVCDKCNENHYHIYRSFNRHKRRCKGRKIGKSLRNVSAMRYCAECSFETSYRKSMKLHARLTGHKVLDEERLSGEVDVDVYFKKQRDSVPMSGCRLKYLVKRNDIDYSIARKRYCPTCAKVIENQSVREAESCEICNTILLYRCGNCNHRCARYRAFKSHLKTRCYPSVYRCPECQYTASIWYFMSRHLKKRCTRSSRMSLTKKFVCEHCSFGTDYKRNLKIHLERIHEGLFV